MPVCLCVCHCLCAPRPGRMLTLAERDFLTIREQAHRYLEAMEAIRVRKLCDSDKVRQLADSVLNLLEACSSVLFLSPSPSQTMERFSSFFLTPPTGNKAAGDSTRSLCVKTHLEHHVPGLGAPREERCACVVRVCSSCRPIPFSFSSHGSSFFLPSFFFFFFAVAQPYFPLCSSSATSLGSCPNWRGCTPASALTSALSWILSGSSKRKMRGRKGSGGRSGVDTSSSASALRT